MCRELETRLGLYFPQYPITACGQLGECAGEELPVQDLLQIAPSQLDKSVWCTPYLKHALNQEALANIDVSEHAFGSRPRERGVKDQTTTGNKKTGGRGGNGGDFFSKQMEEVTRKRTTGEFW